MKDPVRLRDAGSAGAELLGAARRSRSMSPTERARSARRVERLAAIPVAAGVWLWLKGIAVGAGLALSTAVLVKGVETIVAPAPTAIATSRAPVVPRPIPVGRVAPQGAESVSEPPASAAPPVVAPEVVASAAPRASVRPADTAPVASSSAAPATVDSLAEEARVLEEARALSASSPAEALARLDAHAATFPNGKLGLERELLTIDVLRRLGRTSEARARAEALLARSKGAIYEDRVRRMLESMR